MLRRRSESGAEASDVSRPKRTRIDPGAVTEMLKSLMSNAHAVPFLRRGRSQESDGSLYLEDIVTKVECGSFQDLDAVFDDIYKVLKAERKGNESDLGENANVYDDADVVIMAGMMMKTVKTLQNKWEEKLKEDESEDPNYDDSKELVKILNKKFSAVPENVLNDEAIKMIFSGEEDLKTILHNLKNLNASHKSSYAVTKIPKDSEEQKKISDILDKTIAPFSRHEEDNCAIESIFKINHPNLKREFVIEKENLMQNGAEKLKTRLLFHGTSEKVVASIVKNNFDIAASPLDLGVDGAQRAKRALYGKGIYFTEKASIALLYGNVILVCQVLMKDTQIMNFKEVHDQQSDIPDTFDSRTVMHDAEGLIHVIKKKEQILPAYAVTFKNKNLSTDRKMSQQKAHKKSHLKSLLGEISTLLNSDNKTIQRNPMTPVYKHYIEMLEKKESESRDAPSDELILNLRKMKEEISKGGIFQTLSGGLIGMFSGGGAGVPSRIVVGQSAGAPSRIVVGQSPASVQQQRQQQQQVQLLRQSPVLRFLPPSLLPPIMPEFHQLERIFDSLRTRLRRLFEDGGALTSSVKTRINSFVENVKKEYRDDMRRLPSDHYLVDDIKWISEYALKQQCV